MQLRTLCGLCVGFFLLQGCIKPQQVRVQKPRQQVLAMGPMVFSARNGKVIHIEHLNDEQLFDKAGQAFRAGRFVEAKHYYTRLVRYKLSSEYLDVGLYNLGLTLERLKEFSEAVKCYKKLLTLKLDAKTRRDTRFRLGASLLGAKQWHSAEVLFSQLKAIQALNTSDRIEVLARLGIALQEQKKHPLALQAFNRAVRLFHKASRKEYMGNDYFAAKAQYRIGLFFENRFRNRKFRTSVVGMKADLQAKAADLLTAQAHYMRTIRIRNREWVVASLYRIGDMYRQMFDDMMKAPTPKLTQEEESMYRCMLKKKIRILLSKAIYAYERNMRTASVLGLRDSKWIQRTQQRLYQLRQRIIKEYYSESAISCKQLLRSSPKTTSKQKQSKIVRVEQMPEK